MRKVIYSQMVSLDGFVEGPLGEIDWSAPDEELFHYINNREKNVDTHLYGRRTYENMAAYWPSADNNPSASQQEIEYARTWKSIPKIVFSRTIDKAEWNSVVVKDGIQQAIAEQKSMPGGDLLLGGANLAATFIQQGLVDELLLYVHPVILGSGKRLFAASHSKVELELIETKPFGCGVVLLGYRCVNPQVKGR
ncbi:dihydrofolate reductase [Paenibacillaceae bacterium]|nr:dihydrofolate reductase [Paenibacillaceae bacterium]